jgi:hypothetical protein
MAMTDRSRTLCVLAGAVLLLLTAAPATATVLCHTGTASGAPGAATASASAKMLEAASQAILAYRALAVAAPTSAEHRQRASELLDAALADYRQAQAPSDDLARVDDFLRARPFEQLRLSFGITPGTLNALRWDAIAATARKSSAPASELIAVCVTGAESLKAALGAVGRDTPPAQLRRAVTTWLLVVSHGSLVSDAFDASVR